MARGVGATTRERTNACCLCTGQAITKIWVSLAQKLFFFLSSVLQVLQPQAPGSKVTGSLCSLWLEFPWFGVIVSAQALKIGRIRGKST